MNRRWLWAALLLGAVVVSGCSPTPIERAVKRELLPSEANVVVSEHCRSCHIHAQFLANSHLEQVKAKFPKGTPLREAKECLECHRLRLKSIFRKERRSTTRPHGRLLEMATIPIPREVAARMPVVKKKKEEKKTEEKKERKWYFLYLF